MCLWVGRWGLPEYPEEGSGIVLRRQIGDNCRKARDPKSRVIKAQIPLPGPHCWSWNDSTAGKPQHLWIPQTAGQTNQKSAHPPNGPSGDKRSLIILLNPPEKLKTTTKNRSVPQRKRISGMWAQKRFDQLVSIPSPYSWDKCRFLSEFGCN